jgi:hypothetical protein
VSAAASAFERRARRVRRALRRRPALARLVNLVGVPLWRWHLRRSLAADVGSELPAVVTIDPTTAALALPPAAIAVPAGSGSAAPPLVRGGSWDRRARPLSGLELAAGEPGGPEEVVVAFDRRGRTCVVSGAAAVLAAARDGRAAGLAARVAVRHRAWARLAAEIRAYTRQRGGTAYQPYLHPDLADIPSDQGHERFDLLAPALPIASGTLVDLGANSGYFSHRFEARGFDCVAVERSQKEVHVLRALRDAAGRRFRILEGSFTEIDLPPRPDLVLALNIFHHFLKTESGTRELEAFLARLRPRHLALGAHLPGDPQMAGSYLNPAPADFAEWVRERADLATVYEIGRADDGRPLYLLSAR